MPQKTINVAGDRQTTLFASYVMPCLLATQEGEARSVSQTTVLVELWTNPHTGLLEPFYAVDLDLHGSLYETHVGMTAVQVNPPPRPAPDWGGLDQEPLDLGLDIGPHIPIAWVLALLATAVSLLLLVWWLRVTR